MASSMSTGAGGRGTPIRAYLVAAVERAQHRDELREARQRAQRLAMQRLPYLGVRCAGRAVRADDDAQAARVRLEGAEERLELAVVVEDVGDEADVAGGCLDAGRRRPVHVDDLDVRAGARRPSPRSSTSRIAGEGSTAITERTWLLSGIAKRPPPAPMSSQTSSGRASSMRPGSSSTSRTPGRKRAARGAQKSPAGAGASRRRSTCSRLASTRARVGGECSLRGGRSRAPASFDIHSMATMISVVALMMARTSSPSLSPSAFHTAARDRG